MDRMTSITGLLLPEREIESVSTRVGSRKARPFFSEVWVIASGGGPILARSLFWMGNGAAPATMGARITPHKAALYDPDRDRPPAFTLFAAKAHDLPDVYTRYPVNGIRERFDLQGMPIPLYLRQTDNPFAEKEEANPRAAPVTWAEAESPRRCSTH